MESEKNLDPSSPRPPPSTHTHTDWQFTSQQGFPHPTVWRNEGGKVRSKARLTVPFLVLCETPKSLKQQHPPSELKPTGAEAAQDSAPFMGVREDWAHS